MTDPIKPELRHDLPESWAKERRGALVSELRSTGGARRRRRRRRGFLLLAPAAALVAAGAIALTGDTPEIEAADCYPRADRNAAPTSSAQDRIDDPVASCRKEWRAGHVAPTTTAPPLVACMAGSYVRVYPGRGDEVCARLGLAPLPSSFGEKARMSEDFRERMSRRLKSCPRVERAKQIAREELDRADRESWGVAIRPDQGQVASRDCIDNFGTVEETGKPSRVELDYPVPELSQSEQRQVEAEMKQAGCRDGRGDDVDAALAATECRHDQMGECIRPRVAAAELRRQFALRDIDQAVKTDFDSPDRCWSGFQNNGQTITLLSNPRVGSR